MVYCLCVQTFQRKVKYSVRIQDNICLCLLHVHVLYICSVGVKKSVVGDSGHWDVTSCNRIDRSSCFIGRWWHNFRLRVLRPFKMKALCLDMLTSLHSVTSQTTQINYMNTVGPHMSQICSCAVVVVCLSCSSFMLCILAN